MRKSSQESPYLNPLYFLSILITSSFSRTLVFQLALCNFVMYVCAFSAAATPWQNSYVKRVEISPKAKPHGTSEPGMSESETSESEMGELDSRIQCTRKYQPASRDW